MSTAFCEDGSALDSNGFEDCESLDQRVQFELERLNTATDLINKLEIELDEARSNFRLLLSESSQKINQLAKKLGSHVEKARPYYEARMRVKELEEAARKASLRHERASLAHGTARQMVALAEEGLRHRGTSSLDPVFQEMLNQATIRVNEAERERVQSGLEQGRLWHACRGQQQTVLDLHLALKKSIVKARPYFEMKARLNEALEEQKKRVFQMEEDVMRVKFSYTEALHNLEEISDQMHQSRLMGSSSGSSELSGGELSSNSEAGGSHTGCTVGPHRLVKSSSLSSSEMLKIYEDICNDEMYRKLPEPQRVIPRRPPGIRRAFSEEERGTAALYHRTTEPLRGLVSSLVDRVFTARQAKVPEPKASSTPLANDRVTAVSAVPPLKQLVANVVDRMFPEASSDHDPSRDKHPQTDESALPSASSVPLATLEDLSPMVMLDIESSLARATQGLCLDMITPRLQPVEEGSDTDSLLSTGTGGTLDDRQIDCLLLDRVLEGDYQDVLNSFKESNL
ncbi:SH3 domain-binding protein 5-like isoform X2 [Ixodes scapularis]